MITINLKDNLKEKVILLFGGASGIGKATVELLSGEGAFIYCFDKNNVNFYDSRIRFREVDITNYDSIKEVIYDVFQEHGRIDSVVNTVGISGNSTTFDQITLADWQNVISVNLTGTFIVCQQVAKFMKNQNSGAIVNVSSVAGRSVSLVGGLHYTASKAGIIGLTRHLARELAPKNIRVNCLCPGVTRTPLVSKYNMDEVVKKIPLNRIAEPEEQAKVIKFLISDDSSYITGACIDSNGGILMI